MNLCNQCRHFVLSETDPHAFSKCRRSLGSEGLEVLSLVTGELRANPKLFYCDRQREAVADNCGPEGRFFEQIVADAQAAA